MSGSFSKQGLEATGKGHMVLHGSFRPNGSSATAAANIRANWIESADQTATGTYTVTLKPAFRAMKGPVCAIAGLSVGAAELSNANVGTITPAQATGTIIVYTYTEASDTTALADIASDVDNWINLYVVWQLTPVDDGFNVEDT